ncbi:MAG TPA: type IV toxin-antitoxin system AbiEi family antitoxin [Mycobacteriales bacterium]|nr:type IV toxin-antitoxin system AbiEi family antitoxin [Mycobacteriales bacterium]
MHRAKTPKELLNGPFTTAQARQAGLGRGALRSSPWRNVFRDVWVHESFEDSRQLRLDAVRLVLGDHAFVCGHTAAWLHGIDARDRRSGLVWVGCPTGSRLRTRSGCYTREVTVDADDVEDLDGIPVTTPVRTIYDCTRWLSRVEGIVVADALANTGSVTRQSIAAYRADHPGIRWVTRVDLVVAMLEPLSESPMETRLRLLLIDHGLPRPMAQHVVRDRSGAFVARLDLAYPGARVAIEYDGALHWEQRQADDRRRDAIRALGWKVIVAGASDYFGQPQQLMRAIRAALGRDLDDRHLMDAS